MTIQPFSKFEYKLMQQLFKKAKQFQGVTHPNPVVAACIYKQDSVLSYGVHKRKGGDHAEVDAIKKAKQIVSGASMMVTLEPCTHEGETPPCVNEIIRVGIKDVVYAINDPFEPVQLKRAKSILELAGVRVRVGLYKEDAQRLNEDYFYFHNHNRPLIHLKAAMSLDGRIALGTGESCYITNKQSREYVHELRSYSKAIMVGANTLKCDNPQLTIRYNKCKKNHVNPTLIVLSSSLDLSKRYAIFDSGYPTVLITSNPEHMKQASFFSDIVYIKSLPNNMFNWAEFFDFCVKRQLYSVFLEGGAQISCLPR